MRIYLVLFFTLSLLSIGCNSNTSTSNSAKPASSENSVDTERTTRVLSDHPTTADELRLRYIEAYNNGDTDTIRAMVFWDETPARMIKSIDDYLIKHAGKYRVERFADQEKYEGGLSDSPWTIDDGKMVEIVLSNEGGSNTFDWAIGDVDGKFYFASLNPKE